MFIKNSLSQILTLLGIYALLPVMSGYNIVDSIIIYFSRSKKLPTIDYVVVVSFFIKLNIDVSTIRK